MATVRKEFKIDVPAEHVWGVLTDFGAVHTRLAPGFVTDCKLEDDRTRIVTFANGAVAREILVTRDADARRLVYAIVGGRLTQHSASAQVFADGERSCRFVWTADFLPDALSEYMTSQMELGANVMREALEKVG
jgi:carbon monoxide dehydrogenase subunit G